MSEFSLSGESNKFIKRFALNNIDNIFGNRNNKNLLAQKAVTVRVCCLELEQPNFPNDSHCIFISVIVIVYRCNKLQVYMIVKNSVIYVLWHDHVYCARRTNLMWPRSQAEFLRLLFENS